MWWSIILVLSVFCWSEATAQAPPAGQCVSTALAGGSGDAITIARLPCVPTTTLLILSVTATNSTTSTTIAPTGGPTQVVKRYDGTPIQPGDLKAGSYVQLTNNGINWFLLTVTIVPPTGGLPVPNCSPNGSTDNSACVQTAVTNLCASGGGTLLLPAGRWVFHDVTINCDGVHIAGVGQGGLSGWSGNTNSGNNNATYVDCSGMTQWCIHFVPPSFPAAVRLSGGSVEGIAFSNGSGGSGTVAGFDQVTSGYIRDVSTWKAPNAVRIFGAFHFNAFNVQTWATTGTGWDISGNMSGMARAGGPCTLGDCSTRTDFAMLNDVYGTQASTATFVHIHDQAFTTIGNDLAMENGLYGLQVTCAPGQPDLNYCPQQIMFKDFETEFSLHPYALSDFTWFRCVHCYGAGITGSPPFAAGPSYTDSIIKVGLANYSAVTGVGGGVTISDGEFFGSANSCIDISVVDTLVSGSDITGCNGAKTTFGGIEYHSGTQHRASNNMFCSSVNAAPFVMNGIVVDTNASLVQLTSNNYFNCNRNVVNNSSLNYTVYETNPNPPNSNSFPVSISGVTGLGTGGSAAASGNDLGGNILLTAGTGAAASGNVQINFGQPLYPQANCLIVPTNGSGTWTPPTTIIGINSISTAFGFTWTTGAPLVPGSGYYLDYTCKGF